VIETDLYGSVLSSKIFLPLMAMNSKSRILFISSALGLIGAAGYSGYCAAKGGMINFAMALRRELLGKIDVYVACPKDIDTPQYEEEQKLMLVWMNRTAVRGFAMHAEKAAHAILKKCQNKSILIIINWDIYFLLFLLPRFIPQRLFIWLGDKLLPRP
jgi:3-dehydrosphinganine reductase